jgi:hypothetical protein
MNRKRIARLVALVGVVLVAAHLVTSLPREVEIRYALGPDHGAVTEAQFSYHAEGHAMKGVRFHYAHGAPAVVLHRVELPPGQYAIVAHLTGPDLSRTVRHRLEVPTDGVVRVDLAPGR